MTSSESPTPLSLSLSVSLSIFQISFFFVCWPPSLLLLLAFLSSQALLLTVPGMYHLSLLKNENKGLLFCCFTRANGGSGFVHVVAMNCAYKW